MKKRTLLGLIVVLCLTLCCAFAACGDKVLTGIELDTTNVKTSFTVGDTFSYSGLVVTAIYDDESTEAVTDYTVSSPDMSTEGEKTVNVTYKGKSADYKINVSLASTEPALTGIKIDISSVKVLYHAGDTLDTTGLVVTGSYGDGNDKTLASTDYTIEADLSEAGEVAVNVTAGEFTKKYRVFVLPAEEDVWNILDMEPQDESDNKLTVYAVSCTGEGNGTASLTLGWNFFELADGGYRLLPFSCNHLGPAGWWGTEFPSNNAEITTSIGANGELVTVYGNVTYTAEENYWHARILDWTEQANSVTLSIDGELSCVVDGEFNLEVMAVSASIRTGNANADITEKCKISISEPDVTKVGATTVTVTITYTYDDFGIERVQTLTKEYILLVRPNVATADTIVFDAAANGATLELYVTDRNTDGIATAGVILYKNADGEYEVIDFVFADDELAIDSEGWTASFDKEGNLTIANADDKFVCAAVIADTVLLNTEKTLLGIFWNEKREYVVGSEFEFAPERRYSDGSVEPLAKDEYTATKPDMSTIGVKEVTLRYKADSSYNITFQIYCIPEVNWETNKLDFGSDANGSGATLELFITERSTTDGYWGTADQNSKGWLLVKNADGTYEMYMFEFYLDWDVSSHPYPNGAPKGVNAYLEGDPLVVEIGDMKFVAWDAGRWHLVVIGWQ